MIGKWLYKTLTDSTAVYGYVEKRVHPQLVDNPEYPLVVYDIETNPLQSMNCKATFAESKVTVTAWSRSYSQAIDVGYAVKDLLDDASGSYDGINIDAVILENMTETQELIEQGRGQYAQEARIYGLSMEFSIWHSI